MFEKFESIVGAENIVTNDQELQAAATTNYITHERIPLIVRPENAEQLSTCIKLANELKTPVYTVSKGKNWGYGSRVPVKDNNILIELDRMNKILDYNEEFGYVTVEPGVTFQQLFDFLREKKSELIISSTGSTPESSVLANALDRGVGTGLYAERFSYICGLEVILPNGDIIATGMKRFGDIPTAPLYKFGVGPSMDGFFSQSNFGVVSKMTIWLMRCPENFGILFYTLKDQAKLPPLIDKLRELALSGLIRPTITTYNDFRTISTLVQYPFDKCSPDKNTPEEVLVAIRSVNPVAAMIGAWNGEISVRGVNEAHCKMQANLIADAIRGMVDNLVTVEIPKAEILETLQSHYHQKGQAHDTDLVKSFLKRKYIGIPDITAIRQCYWRKKTPVPAHMDPDRDKCGMVWICPVVPFAGKDVAKAVEIFSSCAKKYGFEPSVSLQCMSERAINVIASISWDRDIKEEDINAEKCYSEATSQLNEAGYYAYRDTTMGMKHKEHHTEAYLQFLNNIKNAIDPNSILAPGRYNIG